MIDGLISNNLKTDLMAPKQERTNPRPGAREESESFKKELSRSSDRRATEDSRKKDVETSSRRGSSDRTDSNKTYSSRSQREQVAAKSRRDDSRVREEDKSDRQSSRSDGADYAAYNAQPMAFDPIQSSEFGGFDEVAGSAGASSATDDFFIDTKKSDGQEDLFERLDKLNAADGRVVDSLNRRGAIQDFMAKMNRDFGVKPMDLVNAFSSLSNDELMMPPSLTVDKVVQQLGLNPSDQQVATDYFQQMLIRSESESMAQYLQGSDRQLSLEVMTEKQSADQKMQKGIEDLTSKFFGSEVQVRQGLSKAMGQPQHVAQIPLNQAAIDPLMDQASPVESDLNMKSWEQLESEILQRLNLEKGMTPNASGDASMQVANLGRPQAQFGDPSELDAGSDLGLPESMDLSAADLSDSAGGESGDGSGEFQGFQFSGATGPNVSKLGAPTGGFSLQAASSDATTVENEGDVSQLIKHTQLMIKKGGGEMKVQMTPEGAGQVALKVAVKGDQVQVEMLAENNDTKKLLEKGLGDLKATLASHKLDVDSIKVDVSSDLSQQFEREQDEAKRDLAQQFLQDFRNNNRRFRDNMIGGIGGRDYNSQLDGSARNEAQRVDASKKKNPNRRIDLVA